MKNSRAISFIFTLALVLAGGCTTSETITNPVEGWKGLGSAYRTNCPFGQAVIDDYQSYIRNLSAEEKSSVSHSGIRFSKNAAGQRAVTISTAIRGLLLDVRWDHVLIYDNNNKRVRTLKLKIGRSLS